MALIDTLQRWMGIPVRHSGDYPLSFQDWVNMFSFNGNVYGVKQTLTGDREYIEGSFEGLVQGAYRENGIVFACMLARQLLFSEARFQFRQVRRGRPGDLFGNADLGVLEKPWPNGTTGDLLAKMIQHADLAGNAYVVRRNRRLKVLRPDWVTIMVGSDSDEIDGEDIDSELIGYLYHPGGRQAGKDPVALLPEEVCHFAPIPDPSSQYIGMSWITPVLKEVMGDKAATSHKQKFFENGATVNLAVNLDINDLTKFNQWVDAFESQHKGVTNAYKTLFLGAGAKPVPIGANMEQVDFKRVQGAGETRIAAAAGVPPIIVGLSEGLEAATYSNYGQARRRFADGTMRPLWRNAAASLGSIIPVPDGAELWYDDRDIPFLQEDVKDAAEVQGLESRTMRTLIDAGFTADSVVEAVTAGDWERLVHSGLFSVQLQEPGSSEPSEPKTVPEQAGRNLTALLNLHERTAHDAG
jgi:HK97 family phage portal protein